MGSLPRVFLFCRVSSCPRKRASTSLNLDPRFRGDRLRSPVERGETALSGVTALFPRSPLACGRLYLGPALV